MGKQVKYKRSHKSQEELLRGSWVLAASDPFCVFAKQGAQSWKPEHRLLEAMLHDVLLHRNDYHYCQRKRRCIQCEENERWILSEEDSPCSFVWVCQHLGLIPSAVRTRFFADPYPPFANLFSHRGRSANLG